jgi:hypothetical protein
MGVWKGRSVLYRYNGMVIAAVTRVPQGRFWLALFAKRAVSVNVLRW